MDNGTGDQNHRTHHNGNPDVATVIASCRRGHESRGDQSAKFMKNVNGELRESFCFVGCRNVIRCPLLAWHTGVGGICWTWSEEFSPKAGFSILSFLSNDTTARGGLWPPLQHASKLLGSLLCPSNRWQPSFSGSWTHHPAISFLVFLFVLSHIAFHTASLLGLWCGFSILEHNNVTGTAMRRSQVVWCGLQVRADGNVVTETERGMWSEGFRE